MQEDALSEFVGILDRARKGSGTNVDLEESSRCLPRTNEEFQTCQLRQFLLDKLEANDEVGSLGQAVDEAIAAGYLEDRVRGCVRPDAVEDALAQLVSSPAFDAVVNSARGALSRAAGVLAAAGNHSAVVGRDRGGRRLESSLGGEAADGAHVKKKAARRDDWGGSFDMWGSGGFSPRVDIEAALGQLETGLAAGAAGAGSSVEALDALSGVSTASGTAMQNMNYD